MVEIFDKKNSNLLGRISSEDLQFLIDHLEEEGLEDKDYYINQTVLDSLKEKGLSSDAATLIENAMSSESGDVEIFYERQDGE